ncbi:zinc finger protein 62 homolog [Chelonus insularis]|uniref:zinc finger protein 62 homolog n=1 Tax=Chelonus insularis TaxID=460826 RepID=UPI00158C72BA|nr:zinc finger protein 62 homolog [Chelonus insularis]
MDDVVEFENVEDLCRLCLSKDEPTSSIFGVQESSVPLADKIQACLSIEILSNDKFSKVICINCVKTVNQWHSYKESCLRSQEKLQRWLAKQTNTSVGLVTNIKSEPMDVEMYADNVEVVEMSAVEHDRRIPLVENEKGPVLRGHRRRKSHNVAVNSGKNKDIQSERLLHLADVKNELTDDDDIDCNVNVEFVAESELLINPMALGANKNMEPDSTQKFNVSRAVKKKVRRGPHTHFRGVKVYKQRCPYCQITLHSKTSYAKHIERYHDKNSNNSNSSAMPKSSTATRNGLSYSNKNAIQVQQNSSVVQEEEEIEDVEEELVNLEKDAPLTQVQESIISQLKTFSCYACQQSFNDRRSTLNHIRQHMPDLRPYTCIACLTEFPDRSIYKLHCGASFECAMKIALVVPKHGTEKYFTCNMCLRPMPNRKELLSHLAKHSDKQYEQLTAPKSPPKLKPIHQKASSNTTGPYRNGDPAHNHTCDYCGMIYRYKPNMIKHQDLCKRLPPEERTSYRCVNCGMTFLVFKKFQSHIATEHNKKDLVCFECNAKFRFSNEFLIHHQKHRLSNKAAETHSENHWNKAPAMKFACAVCPEEFSTKSELTEHRNSHLKVKIFSCSICRRMFGNSQALQEHMNDHGPTEIDPNISAVDFLDNEADDPNASGWSVNSDPGGRSTECTTCGKVFANYPNLRRHIQSAHSRIDERFDCFKCSKSFTNEDEWNQHEQTHKENLGHRCNYCKKRFESKESWEHHQRTVHGITEESSACDICGKQFGNETSLKIHRGHHFRRDSRLSIRNMPHPMDQVQVELNDESVPPLESSGRSVRASRKAFSNGSSPKASASGNLQCQVCDDRFSDVHDLRKHLWDVHCAKTKPEKSFTGELQCELCTNIFPDEKSLEEHMKWHKENPILSDGLQRPVDISCDICGKFYSSTKALWKHKKLHKTTGSGNMKFNSTKKPQPTQYPCPVCRKVFGNETSMKKHKAAAHYARRTISVFSPSRKPSTSNEEEDIKPKRPKLDFDIIRKAYNLGEPSSSFSSNSSNKKPVTCSICKKLLPSMSSLYKHRQNVHKHGHNKSLPASIDDEMYDQKGVPCSECDKIFSNLSNMKQHFTKVHGNGGKHYCTMEDCNEVFNSPLAKQSHEKIHMNILYNCTICSKHMFSRTAMIKHLMTDHKSEYQPNIEKHLYKKTDLNSYVVKGAEGRVCPICKITYPNIKAMKIHYLKIHESNS